MTQQKKLEEPFRAWDPDLCTALGGIAPVSGPPSPALANTKNSKLQSVFFPPNRRHSIFTRYLGGVSKIPLALISIPPDTPFSCDFARLFFVLICVLHLGRPLNLVEVSKTSRILEYIVQKVCRSRSLVSGILQAQRIRALAPVLYVTHVVFRCFSPNSIQLRQHAHTTQKP